MQSTCSDGTEFVTRRAIWLLFGILALAAVLRLLAFSGYIDGDDTNYIARAVQIADGRFDGALYHWGARLGMFAPLVLFIKLFGPKLAWVAAVPFCWSLVSVVLAYLVGKTVYGDVRVALLAALFVAIFPLDIIMATQLFPSMGQAALMTTAFLAFYLAEQRNRNALYFAAGVALGLAYLHHETALYAFLPLGLYVLYARRWRLGYAVAGVGFAAVVAGESIVFAYLCGDPLHRFHAMATVATADPSQYWSYNPRPGGMVLAPLISLVTSQQYGLFYLFFAWATVALLLRRDKPSAPLIVFFATVGLYTLWGPVSLSGGYRNAEPWPRYMAPVTVAATVLLARWLVAYWGSTGRWLITGLLVSSSLVCAYLDTSRTYTSIGDQLLAFRRANGDRRFVTNGRGYIYLYVADGMRFPSNVEIFPEPGSGITRIFQPSLTVHKESRELSNCFVAVTWDSQKSVPSEWRKMAMAMRDRRWFAKPLEAQGGVFEALAERLSPIEGFVIYDVPPHQSVGVPKP
jgi:4-amino-4-deoxy-L-arabinose transferase-like glycosyltransferase